MLIFKHQKVFPKAFCSDRHSSLVLTISYVHKKSNCILYFLLFFSSICFSIQKTFFTMAVNVDLLSSLAGNALLFLLVLGMSSTVTFDDIKSQLQNRKALLLGALLQFIILPLLGFIVVKAMFPSYFSVKHAISITLLVVTSSPGGSYSNLFCSLFNADLALSVSMTAISTLLSIALLPVNLLLYTHFSFEEDVVHNLDWQALFLSLFVVVLAIALGLFASYLIEDKRFHKVANYVSTEDRETTYSIFVLFITEFHIKLISLCSSFYFFTDGKSFRYTVNPLLSNGYQHW